MALACVMVSPILGAGLRAQQRGDTVAFCCDSPKPFLAAVEVIGAQLVPWSMNRFVRQAEFAKVTPASIWSNVQAGFNWDPNTFQTNQFGHPYHGNLYFNAGRTNGYTYWQSGMWAFAGSLLWEMAGETYPGAINDWVSTAIGGMAIGESTFRLASLMRDNGARGAGRAFREIGAALVNPVSAFSRLVRGELGKVGANPPGSRPGTLGTWIDLGARRVGDGDGGSNGFTAGYMQIAIEYGDPLAGDHEQPFDAFSLEFQLNFNAKQTVTALEIDGVLWGTSRASGVGESQRAFVLEQRFNYQNNQAFEYGGQSVGARVMFRVPLGETFYAGVRGGVTGIFLGAVNSEYAALASRDYDFVTGVGLRGDVSLRSPWLLVLAEYDGAFLHTVNGSPSDHITHLLTARANANIWRNIGVGALGRYFIRSSRYDDFPNVTREAPELRLFATYTINPLH